MSCMEHRGLSRRGQSDASKSGSAAATRLLIDAFAREAPYRRSTRARYRAILIRVYDGLTARGPIMCVTPENIRDEVDAIYGIKGIASFNSAVTAVRAFSRWV